MKKRLTRILSFCLCALLLSPLMAGWGTLRAAAAGEETRFIFSTLQLSEEKVFSAESDGRISLPISANERTFYAKAVRAMGSNGSTNTLYISFINRSGATRLMVEYGYLENNTPRTHIVEQEIKPNQGEEQSFVLPAPHISDGLSSLTLSFAGEGDVSGTVVLQSLFDVSVYEGDSVNEATLENCYFNAENGTMEVSGKLSYAASVRYAGETLALFALAPGEELYLSNKTPVARRGILGDDFSFSLSIDSAEELYARYVVAAIVNKVDAATGEGMIEHVPLCSPTYLDMNASAFTPTAGFKGFHTESLFAVIDSGAHTEIVDVYLDRLQSTQNGGIIYAGDRSYYYFDETYVHELDRRVRNLTGAGCSVYLRFLVSADANGYPFVAYTEEAESLVNKGVMIDSEEALLAVHAFTDFLTMRYAGGSEGKVDGIILGRRADCAATHFYMGSMGLSEYAELYALALHLIAGTARNNLPQLQLVVPVSDRMWPDAVSVDTLNGNYITDLFLLSVLEALSTHVLHPPSFSVMLESDAVPDRLSDRAGETYGVDRLSAFLSVIEQCTTYYDFLDANILYSWTPDASLTAQDLSAAYALQYIGLALNGRVRSFFVDFSLPERAGHSEMAKGLQYLATHINTSHSAAVLSPILATLKIGSFTEIYPSYQESVLQNHRLIRLDLKDGAYAGGQVPVGSYALWNFSTASGAPEWYEGYACNALSVLNRALTARFSATGGGEYAEFAHHTVSERDYSFAPLMRLQMGLDGEAGSLYEVQVRLMGSGTTVIASAVMSAGETKELYLDLSDYADRLAHLRCVRILARPLNDSAAEYTLRLHTVYLESTVLSNEELAAQIDAAQKDTEGDGTGEADMDYTVPILVTALVLLASVALAVALIVFSRHKHAVSATNVKKPIPEEAPSAHNEKKDT